MLSLLDRVGKRRRTGVVEDFSFSYVVVAVSDAYTSVCARRVTRRSPCEDSDNKTCCGDNEGKHDELSFSEMKVQIYGRTRGFLTCVTATKESVI